MLGGGAPVDDRHNICFTSMILRGVLCCFFFPEKFPVKSWLLENDT